MYLRSLRLAGFKSFAQLARLELEPGVSVVVGPNGSGKSNLVEAVAWAMGTQAPSALRGQRMEDVIFAGTATRSPVGRAEVSLTFDNGSRHLPLDLAEVTITRRLYRDGTSEYQINGTGCRLLDIQELLSDGGVGRHQHVIVGQGQLDALLSATPEDHRAIIEEAAGVLKHRLRKDRAVRRLERTDGDVLRLHDLLRELRRRRGPLRRQAEAAERHEQVRAEADALRLFLGGEELRRIRRRMEEVEGDRAVLAERISCAEREARSLEPSVDLLERRAAQAHHSLQGDVTASARLETAGERLRRIGQVAQERRRALEARLHGAGERRRDLEDEARRLEVELARTSEAERQAALEADRREEILRGVEDEERSLSGQEGLPPQGAAAVVRGDVHALEAAMERDMREAESLHRRREVVRAVMSEQEAELTSIRHDLQALYALAGQAQDAYEHARRQREEAQGAWEGAQREAGEARLLVIESRARVEALERAPRDLEGHRLAAQAPGVRGEAVTRLDVPSELGRAVDACLGGWSEALEARDGRTLKDVLTSLGDSGLGGVALVMTQVGDAAAPARAVAAGEGLEALIDRLGASADQHLAGKLLGDVVLVDRWSSGWRIVQQHPGLRAVTREGDLITSWGVSLARSGPAGGAARQGARSALEGARLSLARAESRVTTAHRDFSWSRSHERAALECLESLEARVAAAAEGLDRLERNRASWEAEMERLAERDRAIADEMAERRVRLAALHDELAALEGEAALREQAWEMAARRRAELVSRREEARQRREEAAGALAAVLERRRLLEVRLSDLRGDLQRLDTRPVEPSALRRLAGVERHAERGWELVANHLVTLQERQPQLRRASHEAAAQLSRARERLEELRRLLDEARRRHSGAEVEASGLRVREEAEAEGLRRDLDADEDQALAAPCPELPEGADPAERLRWLEAELRRMGPVNPLAASEYRELSERVEFLESQLHDLEASRGELRKVIKRLDDQMRALFTSAYEEVASHFEESFRLLFPGGKGRLRLVGPDDLTATGVEIEAQPLGKKLSRLGLLSGGERALVALAFLFAVFQARPSPFYILDEVDAALDDANLRRFLRLVGQLRQSAQLVIVTHQQQTMEAADVLYGVTIEPGGSSQVVSQRMAQVAVPA